MEDVGRNRTFPVETKAIVVEVLGKPTEILVSKFSNKFFVIITQIGRIGNLVEVKQEVSQKNQSVSSVYDIRVVLGKDEEELHIASRFFMNYIRTSLPVLYGLSLKDYKPETLKKIGEHLKNHPCLLQSS